MNSISKFKRRVSRSGDTLKEKAENEISRNFKKLLKENPNCYEVQATQPNEVYVTEGSKTISVMINDIALNDKTAVDEKYIHVDKEENIDVGCYVKWRNLNWLLVFEEVNAINSHKTFVMKRCNQLFKFIYEDELYAATPDVVGKNVFVNYPEKDLDTSICTKVPYIYDLNYFNGQGNNYLFTIAEASVQKVTLRIWLEGCDDYCLNDIAGKNLSILIKFDSKEVESTN